MSEAAATRGPLPPEALTPAIDPARLKFETTADLEGDGGQLGAEQALAAMRLGVRLRTREYNVFLAGLEGLEQFEALSEERKKLLADGREEVQRLAREFIKAQRQVARTVRAGRFAAYTVRTVEEGLSLLTGLPTGAPGEEGTALGIVDAALLDMARRLKDFDEKPKREDGKAAAAGGG